MKTKGRKIDYLGNCFTESTVYFLVIILNYKMVFAETTRQRKQYLPPLAWELSRFFNTLIEKEKGGMTETNLTSRVIFCLKTARLKAKVVKIDLLRKYLRVKLGTSKLSKLFETLYNSPFPAY